jgi:hypothetical protein
MRHLQTELDRLYALPAAELTTPGTPKFLAPGATQVRALCLELARPADWRTLARVWEGVQSDLDWPAPGIAVSGQDGGQLWFSLEDPMPAIQAHALLEGLCKQYLAGLPANRLRLWPTPGTSTAQPMLPPRQTGPDRWAAFVARDLASVFTDEPWLDVPPGDDAQAALLAHLNSVPAADVAKLARLEPDVLPTANTTPPAPLGPAPIAATRPAGNPKPSAPSAPDLSGNETDPRRFLLRVMNDPAVEMHLRIDAAKALLHRKRRI